jgi:hypothetical protein
MVSIFLIKVGFFLSIWLMNIWKQTSVISNYTPSVDLGSVQISHTLPPDAQQINTSHISVHGFTY